MLVEAYIAKTLGENFWSVDQTTGKIVNLGKKTAPPKPDLPPKPVIRDWLIIASDSADRQIMREDIRLAVCQVTRLSIREFTSESRRKHLCRARMMYYYLCKELTPNSLMSIGKLTGARDHTTVLSGINRVKSHFKDFELDVKEVKALLVTEFKR